MRACQRGAWLGVLVLSVAFAGCGTEDGGGTDLFDPGPGVDAADPGPGTDVLPDVVPDALPDAVPDALPDVADPGLPDAQPDLPCTCSTQDDCCDGCHAKNEGGACGTPKPCFMQGHCEAGACTGEVPGTCPPRACGTSKGCNESTGTCEYDKVADGTPCEAQAGIPGSGTCGDGECVGFGACDQRAYGQDVGFPCNFPAECKSGICDAWGDGWTWFCSAECGEGKPACPNGMACVGTGPDKPRHCRPMGKDLVLPGDASLDVFHVCNRNEDCAGGLCLGIEGKRFCTKDCGKDGAASDALCGGCGGCRSDGKDLGFPFDFYCTPRGSGETGAPCGMAGDCLRAYCQDGYCSDQCIVLTPELSSCKDWQVCIAGPISGKPDLQVCVGKDAVGKGLGDACEADWSCKDWKCLDVNGTMRCSADCAETACPSGTCVDAAGSKRCVPATEAGTALEGEACEVPWKCAEGLGCLQGTCLKGCQGDEECPDGVCLPDAILQVYYCAKACAADADCGSRRACSQGRCVATAAGGVWLYGLCRADVDCETGVCRQGLCTEECSANQPCEGSYSITPVQYGLCSPCEPAKYGADCNPPDSFGLNECITGVDGKSFCAPACLGGASECPPGTRCYAINGYQQACAPVTGSCEITSECGANGICLQRHAEATPCVENGECLSGRCIDGRCQEGACSSDADCGCGLLACNAGKCELVDGALAREQEPNDTLANAQGLDAGVTQVAAALYPTGVGPDVDLYRLSLKKGDALDLETTAFCGFNADTKLRLLDAQGVLIPGWEHDDIDPQGGNFFSLLTGYRAAADGDVFVEVTQSIFYPGAERAPYLLKVHVFQPAANDTCDGATFIPAPASIQGDLADVTPTYATESCTGYGATGRDAVYAVKVPAGNALRVRLDATFDGQVYVMGNCADPEGSCVAAADRNLDAGVETLVWFNPGPEERSLFLVVDDAWTMGPTTFTMQVSWGPAVPPANDLPVGAVPLVAGLQAGTTVAAADDFAACKTTALPGSDVFYAVTMPAGSFWTFETRDVFGPPPTLALTPDPADPAKCVDAQAGYLTYLNGDAEQTLYLVVDSAAAPGMADFSVLAQTGAPTPCFGPCDPATFAASCGDVNTLCACDGATKTIRQRDCDAYCKAGGTLGGTCHAYTTPGRESTNCLCEWDCATVGAQCGQGYYTNCTCAATDPCQWTGEGTCDNFCEYEFPADHFDDTADCTPAAG